MRSISTASVLRSLYLAERLASRPQVPGHLLLLASLDTSTALPAQLGLRCHEMVVLPAWRRSCPRDNDRLSLSDLLGDLTAWGSSSCCCSALEARGVAQAMPHGQRHRVRHAQGHRVRLARRCRAQRGAAQGMTGDGVAVVRHGRPSWRAQSRLSHCRTPICKHTQSQVVTVQLEAHLPLDCPVGAAARDRRAAR